MLKYLVAFPALTLFFATPLMSIAAASDSISAAERDRPPSLEEVSIAELEARMSRGDLRAQAELGARYGRGDGVPQDLAKAIALLKEAADQNEPDGLYWLGTAYTNGIGVPKNESQAALLYEKAAQQGHAEAQYVFGVLIGTGQAGFSPSWAGAIPYLWKSADQGFQLAEITLGDAYRNGLGVDANPQIAAYWYRRAISRSPSRLAQANLAVMIAQGTIEWQTGDPPFQTESGSGAEPKADPS